METDPRIEVRARVVGLREVVNVVRISLLPIGTPGIEFTIDAEKSLANKLHIGEELIIAAVPFYFQPAQTA